MGELERHPGLLRVAGARERSPPSFAGASIIATSTYSTATVVVIGNEAEGLDDESVALCDGAISIAMAGSSESLNAGVAGSLIAFEAMWRRQDTKPEPPTPSL